MFVVQKKIGVYKYIFFTLYNFIFRHGDRDSGYSSSSSSSSYSGSSYSGRATSGQGSPRSNSVFTIGAATNTRYQRKKRELLRRLPFFFQ